MPYGNHLVRTVGKSKESHGRIDKEGQRGLLGGLGERLGEGERVKNPWQGRTIQPGRGKKTRQKIRKDGVGPRKRQKKKGRPGASGENTNMKSTGWRSRDPTQSRAT